MPLEPKMRILGAIIAGGRSSRFGSDKAEALLAGRSLLVHAIGGLARQVDELVVCGRDLPCHTCLSDRPRHGLGPLGGIAAALHYAAANGFDGVLTSACDTPYVPADLAQRLAGREAAVVVGQPLFGYWPASLSAELDSFLVDTDGRSMGEWAVWAGARRERYAVEIPNINTAADLTALGSGSLLAA